MVFEYAKSRRAHVFKTRVQSLLELSEIKVECDSNHIHGAAAATGAALTKQVCVEHKVRLMRELNTCRVLPVIPRVKPGIIKEFPVCVGCKPERAYLRLTVDGKSVPVAEIIDSVNPAEFGPIPITQ